MHPAYSVILFTTASGAGYGLLAWLGLFAWLDYVPPHSTLGIVGLGLALDLDSCGTAIVDDASRPAGAGVARVLAMADIVAVAGRCCRGCDVRACRIAWHRLGTDGQS